MLTRMISELRRLIKAVDGAEAVEFALVSIPLFIFLLGVVEFARIYWTQSELQYAAESSARYVTINSGTSPCTSYAASQLLGMGGSLASCASNTSAACGNQVSLTYTFNLISSSLLPIRSITLAAKACNQI